MKRLVFLLAILTSSVARADMDACYRATCRVLTGHSAGTGCVYARDAENYYVLTNAHVAGTTPGASMTCVFNHAGHERKVQGKTIWGAMVESAQRDQALISIPVSQFSDFQPAIIPLGVRGEFLAQGQTVLSVGCPNATWNGLWRGHLESISGTTMDFLPVPAGGRSGSAIFDESGSRIVGLITWNAGNTGRAQTLEGLYQGLLGEPVKATTEVFGPLVEIRPTQQPDCPDCRRRPGMRQRGPVDPGDDGQFNPAPTLPQNLYPPASNNPAPIPPASPVNGCECGEHKDCKCDNTTMFATLIERIKALESKLENQSTTAGPQGIAGKDGKDAEPVDYEKLAALVVAKLPKPNVTEPEPTRPTPEPFYFDIRPRKGK